MRELVLNFSFSGFSLLTVDRPRCRSWWEVPKKGREKRTSVFFSSTFIFWRRTFFYIYIYENITCAKEARIDVNRKSGLFNAVTDILAANLWRVNVDVLRYFTSWWWRDETRMSERNYCMPPDSKRLLRRCAFVVLLFLFSSFDMYVCFVVVSLAAQEVQQ